MPRGPRWLEERFRGHGFRWTVPRQVILWVLSNQNDHLTVEEIYFRAHRKNPHIGLTTVYRTLEILQKVGAIKRYDFGDGKARYELNYGKGKNHHHHLVCRSCGKIIDYEEMLEEEKRLTERLEKKLEKKHRFKIETHQIHFYGVCLECKN